MSSSTSGLFAPRGLPDAIMICLRAGLRQAIVSPEVIKTFETAGSPPAYFDAPEFNTFFVADSARLIAAVQKMGKVE